MNFHEIWWNGSGRKRFECRGCRKVSAFLLVILACSNRAVSAGFARKPVEKEWRAKDQSFSKMADPAFENGPSRVVTFSGRDVVLPCRIRNLNDKLVSWIRTRDLHILTSGPVIFTADDRFEIVEEASSYSDWSLRLKKPQKTDSGEYECQINTDPKISLKVTLEVVPDLETHTPGGSSRSPGDLELNMIEDEGISPRKGETLTRVLGKEVQYVKSGSTITFTCLVVSSEESVAHIDWFKNGRQVSFQASRGGIIVDTEKFERKATSRLTLADVKMDDAGNYTCKPENAPSHSVTLVVVKEERTEAMKRHKNFGKTSQLDWKLLFLIFLHQFYRASS